MSDPMSNMEIEDVLSSIRRLVSENTERPAPKAGGVSADQSMEKLTEETANALVLTPALRVEPQGVESQQPSEPSTADLPEKEPEEAWLVSDKALDDVSADQGESRVPSRYEGLESAFDESEAFEPDGSEVEDSSTKDFDWADANTEEAVIDLSAPETPASNVFFMRSQGVSAAPHETPPPETKQSVEEWVPPADELAEQTPVSESWPEPDEDWTAPDLPRPEEQDHIVDNVNLTDTAGMAADMVDELEETAPQGFVFRSEARASAVEDAEILPSDEPDDEAFAYAETLADYEVGSAKGDTTHRLHFSAVAESDPEDWAEDEITQSSEDEFDEMALAAALTGPAPTGETSTPALDEERLAELVSAVVRAELRGVLGERITHNVRKLVRREVQRALETRGIR